MNIIRLPFRWERLQQTAYAPFDTNELARLDSTIQSIVSKGMIVIIDPHNYARYYGDLIGTTNVPTAAFCDFWSRLASTYRNTPSVWFGLMNEPHGIDATNWLAIANAAIAAIRQTGAQNTILVPGTAWSGAHSWLQTWYGTPNGTAMKQISDPASNFFFEVHQYLDADSSGTHNNVVSDTIGSERLQDFTQWCRSNGFRAFLAEFACPRSDTGNPTDPDYTGYRAVRDMCSYMQTNTDVWAGWTWWAAGPWWGEYMFTLEPASTNSRPQLTTALANHIPLPDRDGDGMGDVWEIAYFGPGGTAADADADADGIANSDEYTAGTDPLTPDQIPPLNIAVSGSVCHLQFSTIATQPGLYPTITRTYEILSSTNLVQDSWQPLQTNITADGSTHTLETSHTNHPQYFLLRTRTN
jgi:endoglucanase